MQLLGGLAGGLLGKGNTAASSFGGGLTEGLMGQGTTSHISLPQGVQGPLQQTPLSQNIGRVGGGLLRDRQQRQPQALQSLQQNPLQGTNPVAAGQQAAGNFLSMFDESIARARKRRSGAAGQ